MASAAAIKERAGIVSPVIPMRAFHRFASTVLQVVAVEAFDFRSAAMLIEQAWNLRAGDALHLAVAHRIGARLATIDQRLSQAELVCGVGVLPLLG